MIQNFEDRQNGLESNWLRETSHKIQRVPIQDTDYRSTDSMGVFPLEGKTIFITLI